ncbi:hypothetical protein CFC21_016955 [Triticum aestivum]|uniref:Uncharacterized protein n=3 Tax=Triticum TaxID=4564 RepID=A0A3B6AZ57_WHEAT|nr:hypothetical protein TRIUR3_27674 [Triticum urartu]KAF7001244.1 hypothetical protein CFC21_016955 [Triticum aestivum]
MGATSLKGGEVEPVGCLRQGRSGKVITEARRRGGDPEAFTAGCLRWCNSKGVASRGGLGMVAHHGGGEWWLGADKAKERGQGGGLKRLGAKPSQ